jgi:hypothetical protein
MKKAMKTSLKVFLTIILVALVFTVSFFLNKEITKDYIYEGNNLTFFISPNRDIEITTTAAAIQIEGASQDYFQLKKADEILYSIPAKTPLGYDHDTYHILSKAKISDGKWNVLNDYSVEINLTSDEPMKITLNYNNRTYMFFLISFSFFLCSIGFILIDNFVDRKIRN